MAPRFGHAPFRDYPSLVRGWVETNRQYILSTISDLIRIPTENLPPGGNERPGQEFLMKRISPFVAESEIDLFEIDDVPGIRSHPLFFPTIDGKEREYRGRPVLVASRRGSGGGKSLVFSGHMDTMPVHGKTWKVFPDPFSGGIRNGRLYGRGAVDMKAGTAAGFMALKCLHDLEVHLHGNVFAESVIDEENGGLNGTLAARLRNPDIDFAILAEPSRLGVGVETIGGSDWKASVEEAGPGGIGTSAELPNPIPKLAKVAVALQKYDRALARHKPSDVYEPDMKIRLLTYQFASGGTSYQESGAVPTLGHIFFWLEAYAGTSEEQSKKAFLDFMAAELAADPDFRHGLPRLETVTRFLEGHRTDRGHPALAAVRRAYTRVGIPYREIGIPFGMDAFAFRKASRTEVAVIGPTGDNLHGIDEYVEVESVLTLVQAMALTAIDWCG